ncbi:MAG: hypothetical protein CL840_14300 [Crocinitomicaceae bacterium]|nr:hypothetical protein [Crocinitomicaceae bacterium]|tara:strand:- start:8622 stop:9764 length:1143 start_codon:yes stop_codon:yes gene_type:complete
MNRLVIVGNGFDLAGGLPTSYESFLLDYFANALQSLRDRSNQYRYTDEIIEIYFSDGEPEIGDQEVLVKQYSSLEEMISEEKIVFQFYEDSLFLFEYPRWVVRIKSKFLNEMLRGDTWSNIEGAYFDQLLRIHSVSEKRRQFDQIKRLNTELSQLKVLLTNYLAKVDKNGGNKRMDYILEECFEKAGDKYYNRFFKKFPFEPIIEEVRDYKRGQIVDNIIFLNFNYTGFLEEQLHFFTRGEGSYKIWPIHGTLKNARSIIFGYGDETHAQYQSLENSGNDELLKNIKSFYYPSSNYYLDLINFLEEGVYDVHVLGHSLGLSDRVLLKTIFENVNCKAIRLFHRGIEQSHFRLRIALSRHFSDKPSMRRKIVEYNELDRLG